MIIPTNPNRPPNSRIENRTPKLETPVEFPRIFGPKIFPSNCWSTRIRPIKYRHCFGLMRNTRIAHGTAPIKGPKNGIMFVTPMITLISSSYGSLNRFIRIKQRIPMIRESISFPMIKPENAFLINRNSPTTMFAAFRDRIE